MMSISDRSLIGKEERIKKLQEKGLTLRQSHVVALLMDGKKNKEIADMLCISNDTVERHLNTIYAKLKVRSRTEAAIKLLAATT